MEAPKYTAEFEVYGLKMKVCAIEGIERFTAIVKAIEMSGQYIELAVLAERSRCVKIAEAEFRQEALGAIEIRAVNCAAKHIAARIREGK